MSFTEEELLAIKEQVKNHKGHPFPCPCTFSNEKMEALIHRLEAAEWACKEAELHVGAGAVEQSENMELSCALDRWKASKSSTGEK